jgi:hypothetical protein
MVSIKTAVVPGVDAQLPDLIGKPVVFILCEPSTRYYRVMTRAE